MSADYDLFSRPFDSPFETLNAHRNEFSDEFVKWLKTNLHVFGEFCARAKAIRKRGRQYYGAKTILEVIRFESDIRSDEEFKVNNNYTPYLARLCMMVYPETNGLFATRVTKKVFQNQSLANADEIAV